jgi:hypothetical protein
LTCSGALPPSSDSPSTLNFNHPIDLIGEVQAQRKFARSRVSSTIDRNICFYYINYWNSARFPGPLACPLRDRDSSRRHIAAGTGDASQICAVHGVSQRRACEVLAVDLSSVRYKSMPQSDRRVCLVPARIIHHQIDKNRNQEREDCGTVADLHPVDAAAPRRAAADQPIAEDI